MINSVGSGHSSLTTFSTGYNSARAQEHAHQTHSEEATAVDRASQIKKSLEAGHYKVDLEKTSHKMAQTLLG
ncbi:flagellar biosynthesis anti-sigma factor FlgM [Helicobacter felis]|uniref:FlgM protein n=1 Tax=Helicobacter felis (strain ATCC 49179 / CCUG 28539 / NCTC 12436 / CS1) TaxID=936155 RepID=E7A937_HELFC|nr:flagellar biosynthesis anti-sigma factor FlgM [Helicobacter felis]CBY83264.1 FlgM protein [Helicobacter felis ATCC 49179]